MSKNLFTILSVETCQFTFPKCDFWEDIQWTLSILYTDGTDQKCYGSVHCRERLGNVLILLLCIEFTNSI